MLDYLRSAGIEVDVSYDSKNYADDKFHIICCSENSNINLESLSDNMVVSENHCNSVINLTGKCIESKEESETQYKAYFSLLGCISKIYSLEMVDDILNEFKEYYRSMKDGKPSTNLERNHIEITDKRKIKYVILSFIVFIMLLIASVTTVLYIHRNDGTHKAVFATNINTLIGQDVFLGRKSIISKMDEILEKQKGVKFLVLVGQGGIGKTTLARHYVHTHDAKIKWEISAGTEESAIKSFLALAMKLSQQEQKKIDELKYIQAIENPETKKKSLISFVFSQLKTNGEWCLLFDNIDDFKIIRAFIPSNKDLCGEGTIIITTRNANCESMNFISDKNILNLAYLVEIEKKELFCNILLGEKRELSKEQNEEIDKFLENIPPMPLDISNAAYYIKSTNASFEKYLEIVRSPNEELDDLHSKFVEEGAEHKKTRYKMTMAAFNKLTKENPKFKELLLFVCLLDSKNIPRKYLDQYEDFLVVTNFIDNLRRFFSVNLNNGTFSIHKSIQEIGLIHLNTLLTKDEKEVFFKKVIDIMTPYSAIFWEKYKTYPYKMKQSDLDALEVHIRSMINALKASKLSISEANRYITKLLLAVGFIYEENFSQAKHFLKEALKYNGSNGYIEDYEYAIALLALGIAHFMLYEFDDAERLLNEGLEFCKKLKDAEILKAYGLCYLGRYYAVTNELKKAITFLEKALSIVDNNQEHWACETASQICWGLSHTYANHYINKNEGYKAITYAQKSLEKLGLDWKIEDIKKSEVGSGVISRWCLAKAYNRVGEHDKAQECADYYYNLYERGFKDDDNISDKVLIDIEYGHTLLRKGNLDCALDILNEAISKKQELNDSCFLFYALVSRTEALIRLNRLEEAYSDFEYAIENKGKSIDNYKRLLLCICFYHAFIIKYKQRDYKLAFEHFSDFCSSIKEFCKSFLSESEYNRLRDAKVFKIIKDEIEDHASAIKDRASESKIIYESQIKTCLQNSLEIFLSIYGKDHPFVKEYVSENLRIHFHPFIENIVFLLKRSFAKI